MNMPKQLRRMTADMLMRLASMSHDLRDPEVQDLLLFMCQESYKAGATEVRDIQYLIQFHQATQPEGIRVS